MSDEHGFSFVIPTLQRSSLLGELVQRLNENPLVSEIILINNSSTDIPFKAPKMHIVEAGENLFVNRSWNKGVSLAQSQLVAICNDDILFPTAMLSHVKRVLKLPVGIVGPSNVCFKGLWPGGTRPRFRPAYQRPSGFGTLMFMRRDSYVFIPEEMRIWFGDDWLFRNQKHRNLAFHAVDIDTPMSVTSSSAEFSGIFAEDEMSFLEVAQGLDSRWRLEQRLVDGVRRTARRLRRGGV